MAGEREKERERERERELKDEIRRLTLLVRNRNWRVSRKTSLTARRRPTRSSPYLQCQCHSETGIFLTAYSSESHLPS
jgi:hypothetical protein